jgi:hypothetical protein
MLIVISNFMQDDYQIGPQHITYLPSLFGPSNMKFNGKDHIIVDSDDMRWQQTILQRLLFDFPFLLTLCLIRFY